MFHTCHLFRFHAIIHLVNIQSKNIFKLILSYSLLCFLNCPFMWPSSRLSAQEFNLYKGSGFGISDYLKVSSRQCILFSSTFRNRCEFFYSLLTFVTKQIFYKSIYKGRLCQNMRMLDLQRLVVYTVGFCEVHT